MPDRMLGHAPERTQATRANGLDEATPRTLCIDIGGTGLKAIVAGPTGAQLTDCVRVETPRPATPHRVAAAIIELVRPLAPFDCASVGFPGVVVDGMTKTAPNLHDDWQNFALAKFLAKALGCPVRVLNDAGIQGYGVVEGKGVELSDYPRHGDGFALFLDGKYVPNLELAHHPFRQRDTYEDWVGLEAFERLGKKKWNKHVAQVIEQIDPIWNPRRIYIGGGNAKYVKIPLPPHVAITSNVAGLLGGIALWRDVPPSSMVSRGATRAPGDPVVDRDRKQPGPRTAVAICQGKATTGAFGGDPARDHLGGVVDLHQEGQGGGGFLGYLALDITGTHVRHGHPGRA